MTANGGWVDREIQSLRGRVHKLEKMELAVGLLTKELARLERVHGEAIDDVGKELQALASDVDALTRADEIADAVAARLNISANQAARRRFDRLQAWGVRVAIAGAVGGVIVEGARLVASWIHG